MKRDELDECGEIMERNLWQRKTGETPRKPAQTLFRPLRNPHGVTATRTRGPPVRGERLTVWATEPRKNSVLSSYSDNCRELNRKIFKAINHSVLPKGRYYTANSAFSTLLSSQPYFSYLDTVHLS